MRVMEVRRRVRRAGSKSGPWLAGRAYGRGSRQAEEGADRGPIVGLSTTPPPLFHLRGRGVERNRSRCPPASSRS